MKRVPGDKILHPWVLVSLVLLALNDHFLKQQFANYWTGKLSDVAGMVFFPVFLFSALEVVLWLRKRPWQSSPLVLHLSLLATALVFSAINLSPLCGALYEEGLRSAWTLIGNDSRLAAVAHVVDPSDLLALPFLTLAYWVCHGEGKSLGTPKTC